MRASLIPWMLAVVVLAGCGDSDASSGVDADPTTTEPTTDAGFPCPASSDDCTTEEVVATVRQIWELSGATPTEAACLAAINTEDTHAVNEALDSYSEAETQAAIECVGSEARMRDLAQASVDVVTSVSPG